MSIVTVATCNLNQWAMDFSGNYERILKSIQLAKDAHATIRIGPELEISGYGCYDHFYESDMITHCWEVLAKLLSHESSQNILIDSGMPICHKGSCYNCRVVFYNRQIILIKPKMYLANDGNYREMRWFTPWQKPRQIDDFKLPDVITHVNGQIYAAFGDAIIESYDTVIGIELCEELFTPNSPHIQMSLDGVEIFTNSSASHHEFGKLNQRIHLIQSATSKCGGAYLYSNQQGCDGDRVYYDGSSLIALNGNIIAQASQFSLKNVEVITASINLDTIKAFRSSKISRGMQSATTSSYPKIRLPSKLSHSWIESKRTLNDPIQVKYLSPEQEICYGPACWLWDYVTRSKSAGFLLPLSGGIDSCSTALLVFSMCKLVVNAVEIGDSDTLQNCRIIAGDKNYIPTDARELCGRIFHTCYMGTKNSSKETQNRAATLAKEIGSYHIDLIMDDAVLAVIKTFTAVTSKTPIFKSDGGTNTENLALQNIQARLRMVLAYVFAQLLPWTRGRQGALLVLGSANVDETLRGYFTKYDCSSADLNPIGGISKTDLRKFIAFAEKELEVACLPEFLNATPTAELEPITDTYIQSDEADMGMTYDSLSMYGQLRKIYKCGPFSMFQTLVGRSFDTPLKIAEGVKNFFHYYAINRHKSTVLTPSYHMSSYSADDNRFDMRPFLYPSGWTWQFSKIDEVVEKLKGYMKPNEK